MQWTRTANLYTSTDKGRPPIIPIWTKGIEKATNDKQAPVDTATIVHVHKSGHQMVNTELAACEFKQVKKTDNCEQKNKEGPMTTSSQMRTTKRKEANMCVAQAKCLVPWISEDLFICPNCCFHISVDTMELNLTTLPPSLGKGPDFAVREMGVEAKLLKAV